VTIDPAEEDALRRRVKAELRTRMRAVRKALPPEARAARSAKIWERVLAREEWTEARTAMLFASMATEVDTAPGVAAARAAGKRVVAPRMTEAGLEVRAWDEGAELARTGRMQVPEPAETAPLVDAADVDLVIVPALALDERGARIGYGAGLYDGLLPRLVRAARIAIAFDFQLLAEIPETPGDERVHVVVTDARTIEVRRG
jgi:5-formyltetrahydrofolate cyclo-ligase